MDGRSSLERQHDLVHHIPQIAPDIPVPEAKNPKPLPTENAVADSVMLSLDVVAMLAARPRSPSGVRGRRS
jgi:hypothetical protein